MTRPPPTTPRVVLAAEEFKANLLARESAQSQIMANEWAKVEFALQGNINDIVDEINRAVLAGEHPSRGKILKMQRYKELLAQTRIESAKYVNDFAEPFIKSGQLELSQLGVIQAAEEITISQMTGGGFGVDFNKLPVDATEFMVGITGDGQPLGDLLLKRVANNKETAMRITDTLVEASALGFNPDKTARLIYDDLAGNLNKALQISRTEQLRVYRESTRIQYDESNVVSGYKRISAKDDRVCPACLMADGQFFKTNVSFAEHPQGRCQLVPVVDGVDMPQWETGQEWFVKQPEETQRQILGDGRFEAWKDGEYELDDLITKRTNEVWGDSLVPTPLKNLIGDPLPTPKAPKPPKPQSPSKFNTLTGDEPLEVYGDKYSKYIGEEITDAENLSISRYTSGNFEFTNELGRTGKLSDASIKKAARINMSEGDIVSMTDDIQDIIDASPGLSEDTVLWRGIDSDTLTNKFKNGTIGVGDTISDGAFTSTTFDKSVISDFSNGNIEYKILAPKGTKGVYMESISLFPEEHEFLLSQNLDMKIDDIEEIGGIIKVTLSL